MIEIEGIVSSGKNFCVWLNTSGVMCLEHAMIDQIENHLRYGTWDQEKLDDYIRMLKMLREERKSHEID